MVAAMPNFGRKYIDRCKKNDVFRMTAAHKSFIRLLLKDIGKFCCELHICLKIPGDCRGFFDELSAATARIASVIEILLVIIPFRGIKFIIGELYFFKQFAWIVVGRRNAFLLRYAVVI